MEVLLNKFNKMKYIIITIITLFSTVFYSQCDNGTNYYPTTAYTPADNAWGSATSYNYAGEVIKVNIVAVEQWCHVVDRFALSNAWLLSSLGPMQSNTRNPTGLLWI